MPTTVPALSWTTIPSPLGQLLLVSSGTGLLRVGFEDEGVTEVLASLEEETGMGTLEAPHRLADAAGQISDYFAGTRTAFELPLDRRLSAGFRAEVQTGLGEIPYGTTWTYKELALRLKRPGAVRAVGTACATNPLPIVLPCHRVLRSDGGLGGYRGGLEAKRWLLTMEERNR